MRVISGLDWSGDAGDSKKTPSNSPLLVTAVVHIDIERWELMEEALAEARRRRSLPINYAFHFSGSRPQIRAAFFNELVRVPFSAHARVLDKRLWMQTYIQRTSGDARIQTEVIELLLRCPDDCIGGQTLLIDGKKGDVRMARPIKTELNRRLALSGRGGVRRVKPCPDDHSSQGAIVQVADMIAGALHDAKDVTGPYPSDICTRITLV